MCLYLPVTTAQTVSLWEMSDTVNGMGGVIQSLKDTMGETIAAVNHTSNKLKTDVDAKIKNMIGAVDSKMQAIVDNACAWYVLAYADHQCSQ